MMQKLYQLENKIERARRSMSAPRSKRSTSVNAEDRQKRETRASRFDEVLTAVNQLRQGQLELADIMAGGDYVGDVDTPRDYPDSPLSSSASPNRMSQSPSPDGRQPEYAALSPPA